MLVDIYARVERVNTIPDSLRLSRRLWPISCVSPRTGMLGQRRSQQCSSIVESCSTSKVCSLAASVQVCALLSWSWRLSPPSVPSLVSSVQATLQGRRHSRRRDSCMLVHDPVFPRFLNCKTAANCRGTAMIEPKVLLFVSTTWEFRSCKARQCMCTHQNAARRQCA